MNQHPLAILNDLAPKIPLLAESIKDRPFLLAKVKDVAILLKEVHINLLNEERNKK